MENSMREIKFRAWQESEKKMVGPYNIYEAELYLNGFLDTALMQFTGIISKDGKEVFEGDIVMLRHWEPKIYEVLFNRGAFCFHDQPDTFYNDAKYLEDCEVIGNIYENRGLLK